MTFLKWALTIALLGAAAAPARAEVSALKIGKQYGLPYIQFVIMEDQGLIEVRGGRLRVTAAGFAVLDAIVADLAV